MDRLLHVVLFLILMSSLASKQRDFTDPEFKSFFINFYTTNHKPLQSKFIPLEELLNSTGEKQCQLGNLLSSVAIIPKNTQLQKFKFINPYQGVGITWGNCAQKKKGFYVFYQSDKNNPNQMELRGFTALKGDGTIDVSGIMLTSKIHRIWLIPNFFMDLSLTAKPNFTNQTRPIAFNAPQLETSLKIAY
jgi:hypothetical protein